MRILFLPVAALLASLVSLCVGTSFAKSLFPSLGPAGTTTYRIVMAALLLVVFLRPWRRRWTGADALPLGVYGATLGCMNWLFYSAIDTIPLGLAIAIEFIGPLAVALWASQQKTDWLWVALAATGLYLLLPLPLPLFLSTDTHAPLPPLASQGIAFALAAGGCWAMYIVVGQRVARRYGTIATPMGMLVASLVVAPIGWAEVGSTLLLPQWLLPGLAVALLSSALPYTLEMYALKHLPQRTFSILLSLEPVVGALAAWAILSEALRLQQVLAMGLIVAASMGSAGSAGASANTSATPLPT